MLAIHGLTYNVQGCILVVQNKSLKEASTNLPLHLHDNILTFNTGGAQTNKVRIWILAKSRYFMAAGKTVTTFTSSNSYGPNKTDQTQRCIVVARKVRKVKL